MEGARKGVMENRSFEPFKVHLIGLEVGLLWGEAEAARVDELMAEERQK